MVGANLDHTFWQGKSFLVLFVIDIWIFDITHVRGLHITSLSSRTRILIFSLSRPRFSHSWARNGLSKHILARQPHIYSWVLFMLIIVSVTNPSDSLPLSKCLCVGQKFISSTIDLTSSVLFTDTKSVWGEGYCYISCVFKLRLISYLCAFSRIDRSADCKALEAMQSSITPTVREHKRRRWMETCGLGAVKQSTYNWRCQRTFVRSCEVQLCSEHLLYISLVQLSVY